MAKTRRFELRSPNTIWAALLVSDQDKVLVHTLNIIEVATCPGLLAYDDAGNHLRIVDKGDHVALVDASDASQLNLQVPTDANGDIKDVVDPLGHVVLTIESVSPGRVGNAPVLIAIADRVLRMRWIGN
jgi:hypothetical protein